MQGGNGEVGISSRGSELCKGFLVVSHYVLLQCVPLGRGHHLHEPLAAGWVCNSYPGGLGLQSCAPAELGVLLQPHRALAEACTHSQEEDSRLSGLFACLKVHCPIIQSNPSSGTAGTER